MKVVIVCDWLVTYAGAERVIEQMLNCFPEADIFSLVDFVPEGQREFLQNKLVKVSFIQNLPKARTHYRSYLPLMPLAVEQMDVSGYDMVISSSHAVAKGILTGPDQVHICYCHTPIRYAWDLQHQYLSEAGLTRGIKSWIARLILHYIRMWDSRTASGVDAFVANSFFVARRIFKVYGRQAQVIHPPVDVPPFIHGVERESFYLTASRMVPYKKISLLVEAFTAMPDKRLKVIGDGPDFAKIKAIAGSNVELLGYQSTASLRAQMQLAKAFVFAAEEDFGITPVEAQACGTPVIAFGKGGTAETIRGLEDKCPTGVFFSTQTVDSVTKAVYQFELEHARISPRACYENALRFSQERFRSEFVSFVAAEWRMFSEQNSRG